MRGLDTHTQRTTTVTLAAHTHRGLIMGLVLEVSCKGHKRRGNSPVALKGQGFFNYV